MLEKRERRELETTFDGSHTTACIRGTGVLAGLWCCRAASARYSCHHCSLQSTRIEFGSGQVPPRFELGSLDSESRVLTITPWDPLRTGIDFCYKRLAQELAKVREVLELIVLCREL
ncbi:hypothetical protein J6590_064295 [Homalodisca vitripennis]|nr:hypothetical protein J6590_064295 [Homalodisca vitripennis]